MPAVVIVGGGIVGLATAYRLLQRYPRSTVRVFEKEPRIAMHQTGHNSGVIHSGIYYKPGSAKAQSCILGRTMLEQFCRSEEVPFEKCGKVIVAVEDSDLPMLNTLRERGQANGVPCELISRERLRELEPHAAGLAALHVSSTGIVDYVGVCDRLAHRIHSNGGEISTSARVVAVRETSKGVHIDSTLGVAHGDYMVNCAGLFSDVVSELAGQKSGIRIVPFRGEYYRLTPEAEGFCKNLIYPVPDPRFPFLGVHFTRMISRGVECGPNAVLAFAREGYSKFAFDAGDTLELLTFNGFRKLAMKYWRTGLSEMKRSLSKRVFLTSLRRLVPEIEARHLQPAPAGVRAQAVAPHGQLLDDFAFHETSRILNVINAPSPAATASLAIADTLVTRLATRF